MQLEINGRPDDQENAIRMFRRVFQITPAQVLSAKKNQVSVDVNLASTAATEDEPFIAPTLTDFVTTAPCWAAQPWKKQKRRG